MKKHIQELVRFAHELESVVVVGSPLDYESLRNFTVTLRAADAGSPPLHADAELIVELLDADDQNPVFSHEHYTAVIPEDTQKVMKTNSISPDHVLLLPSKVSEYGRSSVNFIFITLKFQDAILVTSPGPISAADQDLGINAPLFYTTSGDNKHLIDINRDTGQVTVTDQLLAITQPVTIVIKVSYLTETGLYFCKIAFSF